MKESKKNKPDQPKDEHESNVAPQNDPAPNPFHTDSFRLNQSFTDDMLVKEILTTMTVRKPGKNEWVRVRPGLEWRMEVAILENDADRESYIVPISLQASLIGECRPAVLFLAINTRGNVFLWRCWLPDPDGRRNDWTDTMLKAAKLAESYWVRVRSDDGYYKTALAAGKLPDPVYPPDYTFDQLLELAFSKRIIDSLDHPILKARRGEA